MDPESYSNPHSSADSFIVSFLVRVESTTFILQTPWKLQNVKKNGYLHLICLKISCKRLGTIANMAFLVAFLSPFHLITRYYGEKATTSYSNKTVMIFSSVAPTNDYILPYKGNGEYGVSRGFPRFFPLNNEILL